PRLGIIEGLVNRAVLAAVVGFLRYGKQQGRPGHAPRAVPVPRLDAGRGHGADVRGKRRIFNAGSFTGEVGVRGRAEKLRRLRVARDALDFRSNYVLGAGRNPSRGLGDRRAWLLHLAPVVTELPLARIFLAVGISFRLERAAPAVEGQRIWERSGE